MAENKKSFIAYSDWNGMFKALPDEVAGKLIKHIFSYVNDENPSTDDFVINALFEQIKCTLKRDLKKWDKQREQRSEAGKRSAEVRATKINDCSTVVDEMERNSTVSDNVSVSVNDNILNYIPKNQKNDFEVEDVKGFNVVYEEVTEVTDEQLKNIKKIENSNLILISTEKKEKSSVKKEKEYSNEVYDCLEECLDYFDINLHPKNNNSWLKTINDLNTLDHLSFDDILLIVRSARGDAFWSKNFLSLTKLRRKDKDLVPYWRVFAEKFKKEKTKTEKMYNAYEEAKISMGL